MELQIHFVRLMELDLKLKLILTLWRVFGEYLQVIICCMQARYKKFFSWSKSIKVPNNLASRFF